MVTNFLDYSALDRRRTRYRKDSSGIVGLVRFPRTKVFCSVGNNRVAIFNGNIGSGNEVAASE